MTVDESLLDLGSLSASSADALKVQAWDALLICLLTPSVPRELTTCTIQVIVNSNVEARQSCGASPTIGLHPLIHEYLCTSFAAATTEASNVSDSLLGTSRSENLEGQNYKDFVSVSAFPMAIPGSIPMLSKQWLQQACGSLPWRAKSVQSVINLPYNASLVLRCLYIENELLDFCAKSTDVFAELFSILSMSLEGRILVTGTTVLLPTLYGMAVAVVTEILDSSSSTKARLVDTAYQIGDPDSYTLELSCDGSLLVPNSSHHGNSTALTMSWESSCPAYETLVEDVIDLVTMTGPAAPSGILLTGSPQVGKSQLASAVVHKLMMSRPTVFHWVSVQDLLLQATWADESDLMKMLRPSPVASSDWIQLVVIDDLQILGRDESTTQDAVQANIDPEMQVVQNSIIQIIDELGHCKHDIAILGIGQSSKNLPSDLVCVGRLEKEVVMSPPTQSQREKILAHLLEEASLQTTENKSKQKVEKAVKWAEALSPVTVGCVAGDMSQLIAAAWTKASAHNWDSNYGSPLPDLLWDDLQEITRSYIPMQLADVDVCKPQSFITDLSKSSEDAKSFVGPDDWAKIHELSWRTFGGYENMKRCLFRTVVGPWRRFLKSVDSDDNTVQNEPIGLSPPPGVLFHGVSGTGKSFAATCLGSSLGLPMIKVRASDVMDKWLGGSESIIRSLFARARAAAPCILMFDEIDAVASNRANEDDGSSDVMSRLLSTLLNELDGISSDIRRSSILVVACTNRVEDLDAALLRPGRLEQHIHLKYPSPDDIAAILKLHLARVPLSKEINLHDVSDKLSAKNATGADVEGICREASLLALDHTNSMEIVLTQEDLLNALRNSRL